MKLNYMTDTWTFPSYRPGILASRNSDTLVRLQHPLGLLFEPGSGLIYIADSYNNKIKTLDPKTKRVASYLGDAAPTA